MHARVGWVRSQRKAGPELGDAAGGIGLAVLQHPCCYPASATGLDDMTCELKERDAHDRTGTSGFVKLATLTKTNPLGVWKFASKGTPVGQILTFFRTYIQTQPFAECESLR